MRGSKQPTVAYERLIDRLLATPHYGERWGRHWLDVAGYADSEGYTNDDPVRKEAYKYRDYVVRSFNADKPFDRFITEQVAGDLLPAENARERADQQIATGFLALGPKPHSERDPLQFQMDLVDEQIEDITHRTLQI